MYWPQEVMLGVGMDVRWMEFYLFFELPPKSPNMTPNSKMKMCSKMEERRQYDTISSVSVHATLCQSSHISIWLWTASTTSHNNAKPNRLRSSPWFHSNTFSRTGSPSPLTAVTLLSWIAVYTPRRWCLPVKFIRSIPTAIPTGWFINERINAPCRLIELDIGYRQSSLRAHSVALCCRWSR